MRIRSRHLVLALAAAGALALGTAVPPAGAGGAAGAKWSYSGPTGPAHWGSLDPAYAACSDGRAQSPVNLRHVTRTPLRNPGFHYVTGRAAVLNNTHTVVAKARQGSTMTVGGTTFRLLQIHFHVRSEHEVNGHVYPVEVHFVHQTGNGDLAALGVFVRQGGSMNRAWQPYVRSLDVAPGRTVHPRIDWAAMLPRDRESFRYNGSLTTPPCTEGLKWVVLTHPVRLSAGQIAAFRAAYVHNYRPPQPLHGRTIFLDSSRAR
jgi:carbonic anhydrase